MNTITKIDKAEQLTLLLAEHDLNNSIYTPFECDFFTDDIYVRFYLGDTDKPIIVAFSNAGETTTEQQLKNPNYAPWAYDFIKKEGYSVISFSCYKKNNWFRTPLTQDLIKVFSQHITPYQEKLGYGGSMGGYAVGAYSDLLKLDRCLLFNPISTLNLSLVPYENRFYEAANEYSWQQNYHDGADTGTPKIIIVDPLLQLDKLHAHRYKNAHIVNYRGVGHGIPRHLLSVGLLKDSFYYLINNTFPDHHFYRKIRNGKRQYLHYFDHITSKNVKQLTPRREKVIKRFQAEFLDSLLKQPKNAEVSAISSPVTSVNENDINYIRDLAVKLEKNDLNASLELMLIAQKLRPSGTFINQRVKLYRKTLNKIKKSE